MKTMRWFLIVTTLMLLFGALLIFCGMVGVSDAAEMISDEASSVPQYYGWQCVRTNGVLSDADYPRLFIARSREDINKYCRVFGNVYDFSFGTKNQCAGEKCFDDAVAGYDDSYFESRALVMVVTEAVPSDMPVFEGISTDGYVMVGSVSDAGDAALSQWHVIIEIPRERAAEICGTTLNGTIYTGYASFSRVM